MPEIGGIELLTKIKSIDADIPVIMITAYASTEDAVEAMKLGAEDYVTKPFNIEELKIVIQKSIYKKDIEKENIALKTRLIQKEKAGGIIGSSPSMLSIYELIDTVARTDSTVLIAGESGTGKELIAKAVHEKSERNRHAFVSINCGALPENLLESELFGHSRGAFTDAYRDKKGLFEVAHKGTLFLDEIAEMSQKMQVKLLRAIQERIIRRVGSNEEISVDTRIISATNKDLLSEMKKGSFRSDLFYRLNVISIRVPPLRERKDDIPLLMQYFLKIFNERFNKKIEGFDHDVFDVMRRYSWPGNIRELENYVERAVALEKEKTIGLGSLSTELMYNVAGGHVGADDIDALLSEGKFLFTEYIDGISKKIIFRALEINNSNIKQTAEMLNLSYRALRYLIEKFSIK
jgi:DNA-binding NtrC family response regulator